MTPLAAPMAVVAISDPSSRQRACEMLRGLRWIAQPAAGGADSLVQMQLGRCDALLVDSWLPDLEIHEFLTECGRRHPEVDIVMLDAAGADSHAHGDRSAKARNPRRNELLHVLRQALAGGEARPEERDKRGGGEFSQRLEPEAGRGGRGAAVGPEVVAGETEGKVAGKAAGAAGKGLAKEVAEEAAKELTGEVAEEAKRDRQGRDWRKRRRKRRRKS